MNVKALSDFELHQNLIRLKSKESQIIASIVSHLEEVYRRRLFAHYKCSSIYDYCIRILGYSNGEAHKKISACRLASHCKGVKESIAKGELSLSNAATVQVFLNQCQKNKPEGFKKLESNKIIERVKNKTTKECEIELQKVAKENAFPPPEIKPTKRNYGEKTLLKILLDSEKLQLLKSRLNISCEQELLQVLIEEKLKTTEPRTDVKARSSSSPSRKPRNISPSLRSLVFKKAQKKCDNCGSSHKLQVDHKLSVAKGGSNEINNLRVLCRSCNQRAAIEQLGLMKMDGYINKKPPSQKVALL